MQSAFKPAASVHMAAKASSQTRSWVNERKVMCWKCQKDVKRSEGRSSFMIKREGGLTFGNSPKKFICFACKPQELVATQGAATDE
jgi:hypothetical protein